MASIRPCEVEPPGGRGGSAGNESLDLSGRLNFCRPVAFFIRWAYVTYAKEHPDFVQIVGAPSWIESTRYRINAKAEGNPSVRIMRGPMLQSLLEDRFRLKTHLETRSVPAFALTIAKGGPKLHPAQSGCTPVDRERPIVIQPGDKQLCGGPPVGFITTASSNTLDAHNVSLDELSQILASLLGRPVLNQTQVSGQFDVDLAFLPDASTPGLTLRGIDPYDGASIFTAVQEQLGLRLESVRGPGEFLVIDGIERPTGN